jgi:hypothetical protein
VIILSRQASQQDSETAGAIQLASGTFTPKAAALTERLNDTTAEAAVPRGGDTKTPFGQGIITKMSKSQKRRAEKLANREKQLAVRKRQLAETQSRLMKHPHPAKLAQPQQAQRSREGLQDSAKSLSEREMHEAEIAGSVSLEDVSRFNQMLVMLKSGMSSKQRKEMGPIVEAATTLDARIPAFHVEFDEHGRYAVE